MPSNSNREILFSVTSNDLELQTFRSGGPGGQNQNKRDTGVRWIHHPSGARGESREERSQAQNKHIALVKLSKHPSFTYWVAQESKRLRGEKNAEQIVAELMAIESDFKVEVKDENGKWVDISGTLP